MPLSRNIEVSTVSLSRATCDRDSS
jgi:hypothetical protein